MSDDTLPPLHERPEYIDLRERLAEQLRTHPPHFAEQQARTLALKIAPVLYGAVDGRCQMLHLSTVQNARGMMLALERIQQLDELRLAVKDWRERTGNINPDLLMPFERELIKAYDKYVATRSKDN